MTAWRAIGDTSFSAFKASVSGSPLADEARALYDAGRPHTRLLRAQLEIESSLGRSPLAVSANNPLGLRPRPTDNGPATKTGFRMFKNFIEAVAYWQDKITDPTYAYAPTKTLEEYVHVYAPASDGNDEWQYVHDIEQIVAGLPQLEGRAMPNVEIVGLGSVPLDVPFEARIIAASQTAQRPGIAMRPDRWIQHETGNTSPGADAYAEMRYLQSGAPNNSGSRQQLSFHFAVDDNRIVQLIPVNEVAWHGGDKDGPCNFKGIACELCVGSTVNWAKARVNAAKLCAAVTKALAIPIEMVLQHNSCYGKDCPHFLRSEGAWPNWVENVRLLREDQKPQPPPTVYAKPDILPWMQEDLDRGYPNDHGYKGRTVYGALRQYETLRETPRCQAMSKGSKKVGPPIAAGTQFLGWWVCKSGKKTWVWTEFGTRIDADDLTPKVTITERTGG